MRGARRQRDRRGSGSPGKASGNTRGGIRGRIPLRVHRLPTPRIAAHVLQAEFGLPAKLAGRKRSVRIHFGDIPRAPRRDAAGNVAPAGALERVHQLEHAHAPSRAHIHREAASLAGQEIERIDMGAGQVDHVM